MPSPPSDLRRSASQRSSLRSKRWPRVRAFLPRLERMMLQRDDLTALARGYALLGSGGGGSTTMLELMLAGAEGWPIEVSPVAALDPATPCLGVAFVGSTMLLGERLPGANPFARLLGAVE